MSDEHWEFAVTVPAHTLPAVPVTVPTPIGIRRLDKIEWTIPPGASGAVGFRFTMGRVQVIPVNLGSWLIRDGMAGGGELDKLPTSGAWEVTAYNSGAYPHVVYVSYFASIIRPRPRLSVPLGLGSLQPGYGAVPAHDRPGERPR